jgi:hypothetical protein
VGFAGVLTHDIAALVKRLQHKLLYSRIGREVRLFVGTGSDADGCCNGSAALSVDGEGAAATRGLLTTGETEKAPVMRTLTPSVRNFSSESYWLSF